jgi:biotin transport system substrate-specific component
MTTSTIGIAPRRVLADYAPSSLMANLILVVGGAGLVGLLAQISIPLGFTPVPITGQTLGVAIVGTALGWRRAVSSMTLYVAAGLVGMPWFAEHKSGYPSATFGYLLGFVAASFVLGLLAERGNDRSLVSALGSIFVGEVIIFAFGVTWLGNSLHVSAQTAIEYGLTPFVIGECLKLGFAGVGLPSAWRLVDRVTGRQK